MGSPFHNLYDSDTKIAFWGKPDEAYDPPHIFEHGEDALVAQLAGEGDGQSVEVYECRLPATFFSLKVLPSLNSVGEPQMGIKIQFGSGFRDIGQLAFRMAREIAKGMMGFYPLEEQPDAD